MGDKHWRCRGTLKRDGQRNPFANVHDKSWPEASNALAVRLLSHARVDNTRGSLLKEELSQSLRAGIQCSTGSSVFNIAHPRDFVLCAAWLQ